MPRTKYKKKIKNGNSYYFCRFRHKNLRQPKDLYGKTVLELDEKIDQLKFALDRGVTSSKASFGDYMKRWLDTVQSINKKTGTIQGYYTTFNTYIIGSPLHDIRLQEVTALDVQEYFEYLMHDHTEIVDGKPQLIKGKSINVIQSIKKLICPCIRYAFANQKILVDFSQSITVQKQKTSMQIETNVNPLTKDEQEQFIEAIKGMTYEVFFLTALNTGLRIGELTALTWDDIDFKNKQISVTKNLEYQKEKGTGKYIHKIDLPKTKSGIRNVPIPHFLIAYLKSTHTKELEKKMRLSNKFADKNLVFSNKLGDYLNGASIRVSLDSILKKANIKHIRVHDLRHSFATRLFEMGEDPKTIQAFLGHNDVTTTLNIYTHVFKDVMTKSAYLMNNLHSELSIKKQ